MPEEKGRATISVRKAAKALDVHENTVRNWMRESILEFRTLPSGFRKPYADSVAALLLTHGESAGFAPRVTAAQLDAEADWMEQRVVALRRAAEILSESERRAQNA